MGSEVYTMICPRCGKEVKYDEVFRGNCYYMDDCVAAMSKDCHGIPFRRICIECFEQVMDEKGYDGEYYDETDECIEPDW